MNKTLGDVDPYWEAVWEDMCGPDGLQIWSGTYHDLGLCFQNIALIIPILMLMAIFSAYYFGTQNIDYVMRSKSQIWALNLRSLTVIILTLLPVLKIYIALSKNSDKIEKVFFFVAAVEGISWFTHLGFLLALRNRLGTSSRGPIIICILWSALAVLSVISLHSHYLIYSKSEHPNFSMYYSYSFSMVNFIGQVVYGFTMITGSGDTVPVDMPQNNANENSALLSNYAQYREEEDPNYLDIAMQGSNCFSKLLFYWVNPLIQKGRLNQLQDVNDLFSLPFTAQDVSLNFQRILKSCKGQETTRENVQEDNLIESDVAFVQSDSKKRKHSLLFALHKSFWLQFYGIGLLKFSADCLGFAGPMLLNKLVTFIEDKSEDVRYGYLYAFGLFATTLIGAFCIAHFNFYMSMVGLKIRTAIITTVYRKTLSVSSTVLNAAFSTGEIVNFMSTDTERIVNSCPSFHSLWSIPFQLVVTLILLYNQVGLAFLAGVIFSIILIPINKIIANKIGSLSQEMMKKKDSRIKLMAEVLRGIRNVKIYVWDDYFIRLINKFREGELKYLKGRKYLDALCVYFWATTPVIISILTFVTYVLMGNKLTAATVFTSIALLNMLISPLNAFPWVLNGMTEAWISIKRIQRLLDLDDLNLSKYYTNKIPDMENQDEYDVILKGGQFKWGHVLSLEEREALHKPMRKKVGKGKKKRTPSPQRTIVEEPTEFNLKNIDVTVKRGALVGVIGTVGSGKSTLLNAILAEIIKNGGDIYINNIDDGFGYVSQQPWLKNTTIRANILMSKPFDEVRYKEVIYVCGLQEDLSQFPLGDKTGVGEGGMTLSGGQKARISLARAVYQDKNVYLFDDVLSAVDVKVAKHIFNNCIMGYLSKKTRILCTHHVQYLAHADMVIQMENGAVLEPSTASNNLLMDMEIDMELGESLRSYISDTTASIVSTAKYDSTDTDSLLNQEASERGNVHSKVYGSYWKSVGHLLSFSVVIAIILMQISRNMTDWWLSYWVTNIQTQNSTNLSQDEGYVLVLNSQYLVSNYTTVYYMSIYGILAGLNSVFTLFRAFLFAYGGITAAQKIHKQLLRSIMKARISFFDVSPIGRILNRFSSDTYTVDDSLPFIINILFAQFFGLLGCLVVVIYGLPWLCLVLVPLIPVYSWLQYNYRVTSRELKRISSVVLSPLYNEFNETLQGLTTIRALRLQGFFIQDNEMSTEFYQEAQLSSQAAAQWLALRLQFIGVAMVTGIGLIAVVQHEFDIADPGLVGLAISYALSITGLLSGVVNAYTETEREMIAVERINQYIEAVIPETSYFVTDPPYAWPSQGVITFHNVILKYREHLVPSLRGVSFETRPAEKIGIVGRTGAGKSSLLSALFRMIEIHSGMISIDTVNISHISITALRLRISCIPQDPFLFSGTVRENLDPLEEYRDNEIWDALQRVDLAQTIKNFGGLEYEITSNGSNLSGGQKQLFCLARALLRNCKILCIDEATANVDHETDRKIQQTLRSAFRKSTVITIAHRVQTVLDCDRIIVMSEGQIAEFESPNILLNDSSSLFYQMVNSE